MSEPNFERLRTALLCGEPDRVPLAELKIEDEVKAAFLGRPMAAPAGQSASHPPAGGPVDDRYLRDEIEFWALANYDYVRVPATVNYPQPKKPRENTYGVYGTGEKTREWAESRAGLVTNEREFEAFPWPRIERVDFSAIELSAKLLPPGMKIISTLKGGGIFERVWMLVGFETFCYALAEQAEFLAKMFRIFGQLYVDVWRRLAEYPHVGALWLSDDLAYTEGLMVSPAVYRQHLFPWYRELGQICRAHDLPFIFHSDGKLWEIIPDLLEAGVNALHPIEPKAMDIREVKRQYGKQLCLIGNIDLGRTLTLGSPQDVEAEVRERIRDIGPGGGYCVGSSNTVTEYVPLANFRAMIEATLRWGRYPLAAS
jgi:uroporphyrinogen decarboxylase